jgi:leucyl aminopeptidase
MFEMKQDMNGAATVFTVMKELDRCKDLKINIIAALPLVENAI